MKSKLSTPLFFKVTTTAGLITTVLLLGAAGWLSIKGMNESIQTEQTLARSSQELAQIRDLLQSLKRTEADFYGVVFRNDSRLLEDYTSSVDSTRRSEESLKQAFADDPIQRKRFEQIEPLVQEKLRLMSAIVQRPRRDGPVETKQEEFGRLDEISANIAKIADEMETTEARVIADRNQSAETGVAGSRLAIATGFVLAVSIVILTRVVLTKNFKSREKREQLTKELQHKALVDGQLSQMVNLLQSCVTPEEASEIIAHSARHLFPNVAGTLYVLRNSRNLLEMAAEWGESAAKPISFAPQECWALRQGQMHEVDNPERGIVCAHARYAVPYVCVPLMAHGEVLALLHARVSNVPDASDQAAEAQRLVLKAFTDQMALALSNLNLRITLRQQSIRDPLTGLFNRRYLEETLALETERSKRDVAPFSIIVFDLDHFKRFNDTYGYEAGDAVLQTVGKFLQRHVRSGDVACRYGGEEFTLVLPGSGLQEAHQRAEQLCEGVRALRVEFRGQILGPLTISAGIATYPDQGETGEHVQQAAEVALFVAKAEGRDRVIMSEGSATPLLST